MKKASTIIIALIFMLNIIFSFPVSAEENTHIPGFIENMDELFLNNYSQEFRRDMEERRFNYLEEKFYNSYLPFFKKSGRAEGKTDKEMYDMYMGQEGADFDYGCKYYNIFNYKYIKQYADSGNFEYLIDTSEYWWQAPATYWWKYSKDELNQMSLDGMGYGKAFNSDGSLSGTYYRLVMDKEAYEFLFDYDRVEKLLSEAGEERIYDIKLISRPIAMMYIKGEKGEYLIKLGLYRGIAGPEESKLWLTDVERFVLYTPSEMADIFIKPLTDEEKTIFDGKEPQGWEPPEAFLGVKPTYEAEAVALQNEGLLKGTEKGLDLLKPLSRIEAATMLLRALNESEITQDNSEQIFDDVPKSHWGYGAAENAYKLGLVKGIGDNKFAPNAPVTATQFSTMVLRAAGEPEFNWEQALDILIEKGVITAENAETMDLFTRGDMAKIIYEMRTKGLLK